MKRNISAVILCAGVGRRLASDEPHPKTLLRFDNRTLIARHFAALAERVDEIVLVTGFMADDLEAHARAVTPGIPVTFVRNMRFREGSVVSAAAAADTLCGGNTVLLMDGDVLYDVRMLDRLIDGDGEIVLLFDANIEPGDEPVKICRDADGRIVDFRKKPEHAYVDHGESVGFFRFAPAAAAEFSDRAAAYAAGEGAALEYEEAIRDMILASPDRFGVVDISDLPWTEIDFPEDVVRARDEILPQLEDQ